MFVASVAGRAVGGTAQYDWYVWKEGRSVGPMSSAELALMSFQKHINGRDLVWCQGMAGWLPLGSALGAIDGPKRLEVVEEGSATVRPPRSAEPSRAAVKIVSLSQLYLENLVKANVPLPPPLARAAQAAEPGLVAVAQSTAAARRAPDQQSMPQATNQLSSLRSADWLARSPTLAHAASKLPSTAGRHPARPKVDEAHHSTFDPFAPPTAWAGTSTEFPGSAAAEAGRTNGAPGAIVRREPGTDSPLARPRIGWEIPMPAQPAERPGWVSAVAQNARVIAARSLIMVLDRHEIHTFDDLASNSRLQAIAAGVFDYLPLTVRTVIAGTVGRAVFEQQLLQLLNTVRARLDPSLRSADPREMVLVICSGWLEERIAEALSAAAGKLNAYKTDVAGKVTGYTTEVAGWLDGVASVLKGKAPVRTSGALLAYDGSNGAPG